MDDPDEHDYPTKRKTRKITKSDLGPLVKIYMSAYKNMPQYADVENSDSAARYILHYFRFTDLEKLKIIANNEIAGFIFIETDTNKLIIHELVVNPKYSGLKLGKDLLDITEYFRDKYDCNKVSLYVGKTNRRAMKIYRKFGFTEELEDGRWIKMSYFGKSGWKEMEKNKRDGLRVFK